MTVPHSFCETHGDTRVCDTRAEKAADIMSSVLTDHNIDNVTFLSPKVYRSCVDMNRSRKTKSKCLKEYDIWRKMVREYIHTLGDDYILLDMHSFPNGVFDKNKIAILDCSMTNIVNG